MIAVLYSPKFDEIILIYKTPDCDVDEFEVQGSLSMKDKWASFRDINRYSDILQDMDDWVFLGEL